MNKQATTTALRVLFLTFLTAGIATIGHAQALKSGFDAAEYIQMLKVAGGFMDTVSIGEPAGCKRVYRSPIVGLDNKWELWQRNDGVGIISLRGTTLNPVSWLENFYAAMIPATGAVQLSANETFTYKLATNPRAAVHAGWVIGMAYLAKDILPKLDSATRAGTREFIITGDSQGGALAFLMTSYLHSQIGSRLPANVRFKTYCIAGPKPGNLYYAYDYEVMTQGGWGFNVVNSADWVPEIPLSIQTTDDFNPINPFVGIPAAIRKQKFFNRIALNYAFGKLDKPTRRAQKEYQRFLGKYIEKTIVKNLPDYKAPAYYPSNHYVRTGQTVVLDANEVYYQKYPNDPAKLFRHHLLQPYLYLGEKLAGLSVSGQTTPTPSMLAGTWELNYLAGQSGLEGVFPDRKPMLTFNEATGRFSGSTGCNRFNGTATIDGSAIGFPEPMTMTRMACPGNGEPAFMDVLKKVNRYAITDNTLTFIVGDVAVMRFSRR